MNRFFFLLLTFSSFIIHPSSFAVAAGFDIGFTTSLDKVFFEPPYEFEGTLSTGTSVSLARNEYEAVQLVLFPTQNLVGVTVEVTDLTRESGSGVIPSSQIEVNPVGYVNMLATKKTESRLGWHPDPLLPGQALNLSNGVPQPYLITVYASETANPGDYTGNILVKVGGAVESMLDFRVKVWNFTLPKVGKFKTTSFFNWGTPDGMWPGLSSSRKWEQMMKVADLGFKNRLPPVWGLASSFWSWGSSSGYGYPTHDGGVFNAARVGTLVDYMLSKGANHFFIANTGDIYEDPNSSVISTRENKLKTYLTDYKNYLVSRGLLNMTYVYGLDEPWGDQVEHAQRTYTFIKNSVSSDIPYMQNTNQNNAEILGTLRGFFDAVDINLGWYAATNSDFYRTTYPAQFKDFWWNVNIWPDSHPNLFLEYPLMDARIIGSLSYKFKIQGLELWQVFSGAWSIGSYHPIASNELRVKWDVNLRSLDGTLVYPGQDYSVYSSLRYESFRDGVEDMEYLHLLQEQEPSHPLLNVSIVSNFDSFTQNPQELLSFRDQVAAVLSRPADAVPPAQPKGLVLK